MTPTPKLRFVERKIFVPFENYKDVVQPKTVRILQQLWETEDKDVTEGKWFFSEWRDVPLEEEQA
jgi:predicted lipid carrier protein YhbT